MDEWHTIVILQYRWPLSGWALRIGEGQSLILKTSIFKTKSKSQAEAEK